MAAGSTPCGRHLIVARQSGTDGNDTSCALITLRVIGADGAVLAGEITIAAEDDLFHPVLAMLADGRFALALEDTMASDIFPQLALRIQIFNADGSRWESTSEQGASP